MKYRVLLFIVVFSNHLIAQHSNLYQPIEYKRAYNRGTRIPNGQAQHEYWVNHAQYNIDASFDPNNAIIKGNVNITYTNNSKNTLKHLVIKLKQNAYKKGGIRSINIPSNAVNNGMKIKQMTINKIWLDLKDPHRVKMFSDVMIIYLFPNESIKSGEHINIETKWSCKLQTPQVSRTGQINDSSYFIGYWFPQIAVYDDIFGWDTENYNLVHETYNDVADFNVTLSIPGNYMLWCTGDLQNPHEIYSDYTLKKIEESKISKEVVHVITVDDLEKNIVLKDSTLHTWKIQASRVPDFAFAISNHYLWDAVTTENSKDSSNNYWLNVAYPANNTIYSLGAKIAKNAVRFFCDSFPAVPFPYNKHTTLYTKHGISGMEFPMMANNSDIGRDTALLINIIGHEIAHSYLPFYVNTNERKYAWMDEGWVTIFGDKFMNHSIPNGTDAFEYMQTMDLNTINDLPLMVPTTCISDEASTHYYYVRSKYANLALLDIFKEKGIDNPIKEYLLIWEGKHPYPYDFFNFMNEQANENLDWFWKPWYFEFCFPDLAIKSVESKGKNHNIIIANNGKLPLSIYIQVNFKGNKNQTLFYPPNVWKENPKEYTISIQSSKPIISVDLGNKNVPDSNLDNNIYYIDN